MTTMGAADQQLAAMGRILDDLGLALCVFDGADRAVLWNRTFTAFFPEHEGHVRVGEPYADNLRRFYAGRLQGEERANIDRYIAGGIARHRAQSRPFTFQHLGRTLTAASLPLGPDRRARVWRADERTVEAAPGALPLLLFDNLPDGAMILDPQGRIVAVNREFRALYGIDRADTVLGRSFVEVVRMAWERNDGGMPESLKLMLDDVRFAGAPFDVELPGDRWLRVIERRVSDGTGYISHTDVSLLKRQQRELERAYAALEALSATDPLTGIANRRRLNAAVADEARRAMRSGAPLSLVLIDVDHFKQINDRAGHLGGDACLAWVARLIEGAVGRPGDLAARFGGDEFALLLPDTGDAAALLVGERLRAAIEAGDGAPARFTVSIGTTSLLVDGDPAATPHRLVAAADHALYEAKRLGRNRTVAAPAMPARPG